MDHCHNASDQRLELSQASGLTENGPLSQSSGQRLELWKNYSKNNLRTYFWRIIRMGTTPRKLL